MQRLLSEKYFGRQIFVLWIILSGLLLIAQWQNILNFQLGGADHQLRLAQVRDWISGQSWFDITQYRMNAPLGGDMHWSRLIDIPLAVIILLLRPFVGTLVAEQLASALVPLFSFGAVLLLTGLIARQLFDHKTALLAAAAVFVTVPVINHLLPMQIDHHGWQLVAFTACLFGLLDRVNWKRGALVLGLAAALWIEISIEGLPFIVMFLGVSALAWICQPLLKIESQFDRQFPMAIFVCALASITLFFGTEFGSGFAVYCDALSLVHVLSIGSAAIVVTIVYTIGRLQNKTLSFASRLVTCVVAGTAGIAVILAVAPQCGGDAFGNLNPIVREYWFDRTPEGLPFWKLGLTHWIPIIAGIGTGLIAYAFIFKTLDSVSPAEKVILGLLFVGCFLLGLYVSRVMIYALFLANLFIAPLALQLFRASDKQDGLLSRLMLKVLGAIVLAPTIAGPAFIGALKAQTREINPSAQQTEAQRFQKAYDCHTAPAIAALSVLEPSQIMTGLDVGPLLLQHTDLRIVATGHHRNQDAMSDVIQTFTASEKTARQILAKRKVDYVIGCDGSPELEFYARKNPDGLWSQLQAGHSPDWLKSAPMIGPFQVWQVVTP
ncbi:MAG: hypothetical protein Pars2KO_28710 [Parasphingorhabdus sp.]